MINITQDILARTIFSDDLFKALGKFDPSLLEHEKNLIDIINGIDREGLKISGVFFDHDLYVLQYPDVKFSGMHPALHYVLYGANEQRNPHPLFDSELVRTQVMDVPVRELYSQFLAGGLEARFSKLFHLASIRRQFTEYVSSVDVFKMVFNPHQSMQFNPHPLFSTKFYRTANQVSLVFENEAIDYLLSDRVGSWTHPLFSGEYYIHSGAISHSSPQALIQYLDNWHSWKGNTAPWVDLAYVNHTNTISSAIAVEDPLTTALLAKKNANVSIHPHLQLNTISKSFTNYSVSERENLPVLCQASLMRFFQVEVELKTVKPDFSIIILNYKKPVFTIFSALAAYNSFRNQSFEIIIVDNGSTPFEYEWLVRVLGRKTNIKFIHAKTNTFFGEGNNRGIDLAQGKHILFLNNDCFLHDTFGDEAFRISRTEAGDAFGTTLYFPDGSLQEAGGGISDCGQVIQRGKHLSAEFSKRLNTQLDVDYCSAACFVISRQVLENVWGFDPFFEPLYFEDTDLCMRIRHAGFKIAVFPTLSATHIENASTKELLGSSFLPLIESQRQKFRDRWFGNFDKPKQTQYKLVESTKDKPLALFFSPFPLGIGGGERYFLASAASLAETHQVVIAGLDRSSTARIRFIMQELSLPDFYFSTCDMDEIASYKNPDFFFCMGNEINPPYPAIGALNIFHLQFPFPLRNVGGYEASRLIGYHSIVVNSEYTRHWTRTYLARLPKELHIQVVVVAPPVRDFEPIVEHDRNISLITVGRFFRAGHSKRQDIFLDILAETRHRVAQEVKGLMIGPVHDSADSKSYFDELNLKASKLGNTQIIRDASRDELAEHLQKSKFYIHAAGFNIAADVFPERAEHFGISVVEALKSGCIVGVYELGGPVEILSQVGGGFTYKSVDECASKIALITSGELQVPALNHTALNNFSDRIFFDSIKRIASMR